MTRKKPKPKPIDRSKNTGKGVPNRNVAPFYRAKLVEYLSDPENPSLTREEYAKNLLGIARNTLYKHFSPETLAEIEAEGLGLRRARCAGTSANVDRALVNRALAGDVGAIKLYYQRIEGWSERSTVAVEPNLEDLRELAISKGYDPEEYVATYLELRRRGGAVEPD